MLLIMSALAVIGGLFFAVQGPTNSALGNRTNVFLATTTSFGVGSLFLVFIVIFFGNGHFSELSNAQAWQLVGGIYGAINVLTTISIIPIVGVSLTLTTVMLAQLLMGAIIDWFGLFGCEQVPVIPMRIFGILIVAAGILLVYFAGMNNGERESKLTGKKALLVPAAFLGGMLGTIQTPVNASLAGLIGSWEGTLFSFVAGFAAISLVTLIRHFLLSSKSFGAPASKLSGKSTATLPAAPASKLSGNPTAKLSEAGIRLWMLLGGFYGVAGIFLNLFTVVSLGTALQVACSMVGQLFGALVIDSLGILQTKKIPISPLRAMGILVIAVGVLLVTFARGI